MNETLNLGIYKALERRGTLTLVVCCNSGGSFKFMRELVKEKSTNWHVAGTWWEFTGTLKKPRLDWIWLDCGNLDQIVLAQRCIYTHTLIADVNWKTNLLSWASMNTAYYDLGLSQGGIFTLEWELVYKTDKKIMDLMPFHLKS